MAKNEIAKNKKKKAPFAVLRKAALCALIGATALTGGLLVGCDETSGVVAGPTGVNFYYGDATPNTADNPGKIGDFYIEKDTGDVYQLTAEGWGNPIANIKGPQGIQGVAPTVEISEDGFWVINGEKSDVRAEGLDGSDGVDGKDGVDGEDGKDGVDGKDGEDGEDGVGLKNVTLSTTCDADGNVIVKYTFHYTDDTTTTQEVYANSTIYVGNYMTLERAFEVVPEGGTVQLKNDLVVEKVTTVNKKATLDLAGRAIYNTKDIWGTEAGAWSLISVREGGELTIKDSGIPNDPYNDSTGIIMAKADDCYAADVQDGGKLIVNGGVLVGNVSAVYVHTGELIVNDGSFAIQQLDQDTKDERFTLNCLDANYKNGTAKITVNGGYFVNYNPAKDEAEGVGTNFVAPDKMVVSQTYGMPDGSSMEVFEVMSGMEVLQAMAEGYLSNSKITLAGDVALPSAGLVIDNDMALDLNGYTISVPNDTVGDGVFHVINGATLTIDGEGVVNGLGDNGYCMAIWADGGNVVINGGTYTNVGAYSEEDGAHFDLVYVKNGGTVTINGGVFEGETPKWLLNSHNTQQGTIIVKGGTFKGYNPAESMTDELGADKASNFVAEGYKVVSETQSNGDVWYTVVAE